MDKHQIIWNEKVAEKLIKNFEKRRMEGSYAATATQAKNEVIAMIPAGSSVFRCGTMTATYAGLWDAIAKLPEVELIDPYEPGIKPEEGLARRQKGMSPFLWRRPGNHRKPNRHSTQCAKCLLLYGVPW